MKSLHKMAATLIVFSSFLIPLESKTAVTQVSSDQMAIQQAIADLNQYKQMQKKLGIQDAELSYGMKKAIVLADLLLTPSGTLNFSRCGLLKSYFVPEDPEEYEMNIERILDKLDGSWEDYLDRIFKPEDHTGVSSQIIKAMLGIPPGETVTNRDAKKAVLTSLFSPYNQGPVGDCFAVSDLIRDHNEYYRHSAKDYAEIVQYGYLRRMVNDAPDNFFFLPIIADDDQNNTLTIDRSANIGSTNVSLFNAPGFAAAAKMMGCPQISTLSKDVLSVLFRGSSAPAVTVSATQVIGAFAQAIAAQQSGANMEDLVAKGEYGFSSLTNNPVLRAAECAFAAMAEDRSQDSTRGNVNDCVAQALKNQWSSLGSDQTVADFQNAFTQQFNASYRLLYNADIPLPQVSADGSSTDGGFQMYRRALNAPTNMGTRVATPEEFRQLLMDAITASEKQFNPVSVRNMANSLRNFVRNGTFLRDALWAYDSSNQQVADPVADYQKLSRTPMQSCDGDNPFEVSDIDTGTTYDNNVQTYTPNNMKDLLNWCMNLAKVAPHEMCPMDSPQHAFNFVPANSDLAAFLKSGMKSDQWIREVLAVPGMKVSTRLIDANTEAALNDAMLQMISNALPDPTSYQNLTASLSQKSLTLQQYAQALLDGINNLLGSDAGQTKEVALALDGALLQAIPSYDATLLQKTAIRFAFTNWNDETKDIYFCGYFNPRTQKVAFGMIDEDKTKLQPMDEGEWIIQQQWDVDLRPYAPKK